MSELQGIQSAIDVEQLTPYILKCSEHKPSELAAGTRPDTGLVMGESNLEIIEKLKNDLYNEKVDVVKPIAILLKQNTISNGLHVSPYFGVYTGLNLNNEIVTMDAQFLIHQLVTQGVMSSSCRFPSDYNCLQDFYIANRSASFMFDIDALQHQKVEYGQKVVEMFYIIGVKQSKIDELFGDRKTGDFQTSKELTNRFFEALNAQILASNNGSNAHIDGELLLDIKTRIPTYIPNSNVMPNIDICKDGKSYYVYSSVPIHADIFKFEFLTNSDVEGQNGGRITAFGSGGQEEGNNVFTKQEVEVMKVERLKEEQEKMKEAREKYIEEKEEKNKLKPSSDPEIFYEDTETDKSVFEGTTINKEAISEFDIINTGESNNKEDKVTPNEDNNDTQKELKDSVLEDIFGQFEENKLEENNPTSSEEDIEDDAKELSKMSELDFDEFMNS